MNAHLLHLYCQDCEEAVYLRAEIDSLPRCPHCRRDSLVLLPDENSPVSPASAAEKFDALRAAIA